jgi:Cys-Gly metallodipeptidase DUG1
MYFAILHENKPMTDLIAIMAKLVSPDGKIMIPGIYDDVAPLTADEEKMYATISFTLGDIHQAVGAENTIHDTEKEALMARWRYPCLSLHGIEGAFYSTGAKTVIPAKVIGKFSIRSVPNMLPEKVFSLLLFNTFKISALVIAYVKGVFKGLKSKNRMSCVTGHGGKVNSKLK